MKATITFELDSDRLERYSDEHLAALWYVTQANNAPIENRPAGEIAEHVGREIVRRFLRNTPPLLWEHQGRHADWWELHRLTEKQPAAEPQRYSAPDSSFARVARDEELPWDSSSDTGKDELP